MNRRTLLQSGCYALGLSAFPSWIRLLNPAQTEMILMRRNVGFFKESGGTIGWLMDPGGIAVVDSQFPEAADHFLDLLFKGNFRPIDYLINTHHHPDHTAGNIAFKGIASHVLAHENSKVNQINVAKRNNTEDQQLYPDITFTTRWQGQVGDETIDVQYMGPAHTNGDAIIHFQQANIAHLGDLVFNRRYPFIDRSAGANIENWVNILGSLQSYFDQDTRFIWGHTREGFDVTGSKEDIAAFADYLSALLDFVGLEIRNGKSKEEILLATAIPGAPEWTGDGIQRSLTAAYDELMTRQ